MKGINLYKHIRKVGLQRLVWPLIPILFAIITINWVPFKEIIYPIKVSSTQEAISAVENGYKYLELNLDSVTYSGYNYMKDSDVYGEYYYDLIDDNTCIFFLFDPVGSDEQKSVLSNVIKKVRVVETDGIFDNMLEMFSGTIDWTYEGVDGITKDYILTEKGYNRPLYIVMFVALVALLAYGSTLFMYNLTLVIMPWMNPKLLYTKLMTEKSLLKIGKFVSKIESEMENVQSLGGGMYITEHFFVDISKTEFSVVPLDEIKIAYEHGTLKSFMGIHLDVTYTLHLQCSKIIRFHAPRKRLDDVHAVLDYLKENRQEILIGYTNENRKLFRRILRSSARWFRG